LLPPRTDQHLWRCSVMLRIGLLARQTSSLLRPSPIVAGCRRIERRPADLESSWPPWPAPRAPCLRRSLDKTCLMRVRGRLQPLPQLRRAHTCDQRLVGVTLPFRHSVTSYRRYLSPHEALRKRLCPYPQRTPCGDNCRAQIFSSRTASRELSRRSRKGSSLRNSV
jgi:hypothetical protein